MKTQLLSLALAGMFAGATVAHGDPTHAASAAKTGAQAADGHAHEYGHGDADAIGVPGQAAKVARTVTVDMTDAMRFEPASVTARQGETIRFAVKNSGQLKHEFVLGTEKELQKHYELMKKFPEMEHSDPNMVTVAPGKTAEVIWQFTKAGKIDFACLQPGHYDAGMKGAVKVASVEGAIQSMTGGEVRKVDKENRKITLRHGEIKSLEMPSMTMVFQVKDPAMLDTIKPGDKVVFKADKANGALVITEIQAAK